MQLTRLFVLLCVFVSALLAASFPAQAQIRLTESEFFNSLDLDLAGLEDVKTAVTAEDWIAARAAFADYLRTREPANWYIDWRDRPDPPSSSYASASQMEAADKALDHIFNIKDYDYQFTDGIDWDYNPTFEPDYPGGATDEWIYSFHRLEWWRSLGAAYWSTGDEDYALEFVYELTSWMDQNPTPIGFDTEYPYRWRTLEIGIRMRYAFPYAFRYFLSSPNMSDELIMRFVKLMVEHARYIDAYHSFGGNWLFTEMRGIYTIGTIFPEFEDAVAWRQLAVDELADVASTDFYPDGYEVELAPGYHLTSLYDLEAFLQIVRMNDAPLPENFESGMEAMFECLLKTAAPDWYAPPFNDSDWTSTWGYLGKGFALFPDRTDFQFGSSKGTSGTPPDFTSVALPYSGFVCMRSGWDTNARYLALDAGPYGTSHQHQDKLNVVMNAYGRRLVCEMGKYLYDDSDWRVHAISSYGHNLVIVDGKEQTRSYAAPNMTTPLPFTFETNDNWDYFKGSYGGSSEPYGYSQLARQTREVLFVKRGTGKDFWIVADTMEALDGRSHSYESIFHLRAPSALLDPSTSAVKTEHASGANMGIYPLQVPGLSTEVIQGQTSPQVQGWLVEEGQPPQIVEAPTPHFRLSGWGIKRFFYVFYPVSSGTPPDITVEDWDVPELPTTAFSVEIQVDGGESIRVRMPDISSSGERYLAVDDGTGWDVLASDGSVYSVPEVSTIEAISPDSSAQTLQYRVTFTESVTGVDRNDFQLDATGEILMPSIQSVSGSGSVYTVNVDRGYNSGTLTLVLHDNDSIVADGAAHLGGLGYGTDFTGDTYTIKVDEHITVPIAVWPVAAGLALAGLAVLRRRRRAI